MSFIFLLGLVGVLEMPLQWTPAVLIVLFLHFLAGFKTPFGYANHETAKQIVSI
jgi:hypothetical protein